MRFEKRHNNVRFSYKNGRSVHADKTFSEECTLTHKKIFTRCIVAFLLMSCMFLLSACEKSYSMSQVDIAAEITSDGRVHIVEERVFDFNGDFTTVWWSFENLAYGQEVVFNGASLQKLNSDGSAAGEEIILDEVAFETLWRVEGGPGTDAYSLDVDELTAYMFFSASNEKLKITVDYEFINIGNAYEDVADFSWEFVGSTWAVNSDNVTMRVTLPVGAGESVVAEDTVYAWGHGALNGHIEIEPDGSVVYTVPSVSVGQFAEARIVFPVSWLTDVDEGAIKPYSFFNSIYQEEAERTIEANNQRTFSLIITGVPIVISLALLAWAIYSFVRYGREHEPAFKEEYWRDVPSPIDHPIVISRLWTQNQTRKEDFTAAMMNLSQMGAVQINKGSYADPQGRIVEDYYITKVPTVASTLTNPIDLKTMDILFNRIAKGNPSLWFKSIELYGEADPEKIIADMDEWQKTVTAEVGKRHFFEEKSEKKSTAVFAVGVLYGVLGSLICFFMENFLPLLFVIPVAIVLIVLGILTSRRSPEAATIYEKCKALNNWLKNFSALDERPPTDVKVWGVFMVYAYIFGIAKQVMQELQLKIPQIFEDSNVDTSSWIAWHTISYNSHGTASSSIGDAFSTAISNTVGSAQAAISAASGDSSGFGGGGGFSSGGGGSASSGGGAR